MGVMGGVVSGGCSTPEQTLPRHKSVLEKANMEFLKRLYLFILERGKEGERWGEKHQCVAAS